MYKSVGCDNELDGKTAIDRCGVCGGDGDTCRTNKTFPVHQPVHTCITGVG